MAEARIQFGWFSAKLKQAAEKLNSAAVLKGHDFSGCGKTRFGACFVTGHDFSRAANAAKSNWALAPAMRPYRDFAVHFEFFRSLFTRAAKCRKITIGFSR